MISNFSVFKVIMMKVHIALFVVCVIGVGCTHGSWIGSPSKSEKPKDFACDVCLYVVNEIDKYLAQEPTIEQIMKLVYRICDLIGDQFPGGAESCKIVLQTQIPVIIEQLINNQLSPEEICKNECGTNKE